MISDQQRLAVRSDVRTLAKCMAVNAACFVTIALSIKYGGRFGLLVGGLPGFAAFAILAAASVLAIPPAGRLVRLIATKRLGPYAYPAELPDTPYIRLTENQFDYSKETPVATDVRDDIANAMAGALVLAGLFLFIHLNERPGEMPNWLRITSGTVGAGAVVAIIRAVHRLLTFSIPNRRTNVADARPDASEVGGDRFGDSRTRSEPGKIENVVGLIGQARNRPGDLTP